MKISEYFKASIILACEKANFEPEMPSKSEKKEYKNFAKSLEKNCKKGYGIPFSLQAMKVLSNYPLEINCENINDNLCPSYTIESIINENPSEPKGLCSGNSYELKINKNLSKIIGEYFKKKGIEAKPVSLSFKLK